MIDVAILGGGKTGRALGDACLNSKLSVLIIDDRADKPDAWNGEWVKGRGVVSATGLVAILDPATGDEKRIVQATAMVVAAGALDPRKPSTRMLGITKTGAVFSADGNSIVVDRRGRTRAAGVYAAGSSAASATPDIVEDLVSFCASSSK